MEIGEDLEVRFTLPGTDQPCVALCTVQWTREHNVSTPDIEPGIGCKFTRI